jgi:hypothetical protein
MEVQWLVRDGGRVESCRAVFGDESQDYSDESQFIA